MSFLIFNLGGGELVIVILVVLLFFGSKKIPGLARGLGKGIREFKNAANEVQKEMQETTKPIKDETDITKHLKD